jgi:hypothetical protein
LEKPKAHLELWHAVRTIGGSRYLVGVVVGHPTMVNGQRIVTSDLICVRMVADQQIEAETANTTYSLGDVGTARPITVSRGVSVSAPRRAAEIPPWPRAP